MRILVVAILFLLPTVAFAQILFNEVTLSPTEERFIELYNSGDADVDLTGWYVQRKTATGSTFGSLVSSSKFENDETNKYIQNQTNGNEKKILREIIYLKDIGWNIITSQDLLKRTNLSKSTISRALDNFEVQLGIINTEERNLGRGKGKIRMIYMAKYEYDLLN